MATLFCGGVSGVTTTARAAGLSKTLPNLYEISTRPWLYELSQQYQRPIRRIRDIPFQEFEKLAARGIAVVWMMGVWSLGRFGLEYDRTDPDHLAHYSRVLPGYTLDDVIGSPYAITNHTCNPEIGSDSDLAALRKALNAIGIQLWLDFVPNHSAVDSVWTSSRPEYYIRAPRESGPPYDPSRYLANGIAFGGSGWGDSWKDTAQLNYWEPQLRQAMLGQLLRVASVSDGIRCDMAYLVINDVFGRNWRTQLDAWGYHRAPDTEFWTDAIGKVKATYPHVRFLAEVYSGYEGALQSQGFDFTYEKTLYDRLVDGNLDGIRHWLQYTAVDYFHKSAHFVENHDEERAVAEFGSWPRANAAAVVTMTVPGLRFYNMGQFAGKRNRLAVQLRRSADEPVIDAVETFYAKLLAITSADVFHSTAADAWTYIAIDTGSAATAWRLMAWRWAVGSERRLVVVNYSDAQGQGRVVVANAPHSSDDSVLFRELFTGAEYRRSRSEVTTQGLYVIIEPFAAQIFQY